MSKELEPIWAQLVWKCDEDDSEEINRIGRLIIDRINENYEDYGIRLILADGFSNVLHLIFHLKATQSLNQIIAHIKSDTRHYLIQKKSEEDSFDWYDGHRSFSIDIDAVEKIRVFIENQKQNPQVAKYNLNQT